MKAKPVEKGHLKKGALMHTKESADRGRARQHRAQKSGKAFRSIKTPPLNWGSS